jgi:hypothetical protein
MKKVLLFILSIPVWYAFAAIPNTAGWYQIPNTALSNVCACTHGFAAVCGASNCGGIFAWSSGVFDTKRNRMIIWGGGHNDYYGNEIYSLDLNALTMSRLTDPDLPTGCLEQLAGGLTPKPNSRHTYDGLVYMPNVDRMFAHGGCLASSGCGPNKSNGTWTYSFANALWEKRVPTANVPPLSNEINTCDYDPNTGKVYFDNNNQLYAYDYATNTFATFAASAKSLPGYWYTGVIDPKRRKFVMMGGGSAYIIDIGAGSTYVTQTLTTTGGDAMISAGYPGLAYDPVRDRIVAWSGGNTVYSLNMDTYAWTSVTYTGGPGAAVSSGTYKRWSYSPALDCFVLVNGSDQNAFTFRFPGSAVETRKTLSPEMRMDVSPNPVSKAAVIRLAASSERITSLAIYDTRGNIVDNLESALRNDANAGFTWNTRALPSGVYMLEARSTTHVFSKRIFLSK